ncbi:rod shape-determining protein [Veillonella rogosae]|uniref:rod shape-determining protein n=1 Tax=Veillonella rogosae TaxID=423477 RepID=UPI0006D0AD3F|nr:rod shape-determining protein [Veillonella rogosae]
MFGLTNKSTEPKQNNKKRSRRSKGPALYNEQQNLGAAKVENSKASATRKPLRRTKRKSTKLSEGVAKQANHLASNMREAMVKVTKMRRAERRSRETVAIAKTTPAMTLKRLVRPEQVGDLMGRLNRSLNFDLGIDLGTASILIFAKGKGLVLDEPSYIARDDKTGGDILALGEAARSMVGRTPKGISVIRPVQAGVIADYDMTEFMLKYFIRSVVPASRLMKTRIIVCVPSGITPVEKRAILEALLRTGAKKTVLIEEPLAAAMGGTGLNDAKQVGAMVVDVGGGTTDIAVLCDTGVVVSESLRIGGDSFNESIIRYIRRKKRLVIGPLTAEKIKISVGTVDRRAKERTIEVRGRDASSGLPKMVAVNSLEIQRALEAQVMNILEGIKSILEKTPPELVAAINDHGIILTGGGALIDGLDRVITRSIGIAAYLVESPRYAVIKGVAKALDEMSQLRDTLDELQ